MAILIKTKEGDKYFTDSVTKTDGILYFDTITKKGKTHGHAVPQSEVVEEITGVSMPGDNESEE